jgi:hypothetical protein
MINLNSLLSKLFILFCFFFSFNSYGQLTFEEEEELDVTDFDRNQAISLIKPNISKYNKNCEIVFVDNIWVLKKKLKSDGMNFDIKETYYSGHLMKSDKIFKLDEEVVISKNSKPFVYYSIRKTELTISLYVLSGEPKIN